jgi:hypothetical protein
MSARDEIWVDMVQFDTETADRVWDGALRDADAPHWYRDLRGWIHRARGPAEADELADESLVVESMRRVTLDDRIAELPRRKGVRTLGRVVAMKAAAAATTSVVSVAAAAATTGIVATVAATVVVPVIHEKVIPAIEDQLSPAASGDDSGDDSGDHVITTVPVPTQALPSPGSPRMDECRVAGFECPDPAPVIEVTAPAPAAAPLAGPVTAPTPAPTPAAEPEPAPAPDVEPKPAPEPAPAVGSQSNQGQSGDAPGSPAEAPPGAEASAGSAPTGQPDTPHQPADQQHGDGAGAPGDDPAH